jgi:hypothetical protein
METSADRAKEVNKPMVKKMSIKAANNFFFIFFPF